MTKFKVVLPPLPEGTRLVWQVDWSPEGPNEPRPLAYILEVEHGFMALPFGYHCREKREWVEEWDSKPEYHGGFYGCDPRGTTKNVFDTFLEAELFYVKLQCGHAQWHMQRAEEGSDTEYVLPGEE